MQLRGMQQEALRASLVLLIAASVIAAGARPVPAQSRASVTADTINRWMEELSNWGRWGEGDEAGAVNLITTEKRKQAARLVKTGVSVSLAHNPVKEKAADNPSPFEHEMILTGINNPGQFSMDRFTVAHHGVIHSHLDALCHMFYQERMYNGFSQTEVSEEGCQKLAVTQYKEGIFTRGVLIDIPRLKDVPYLEPGTPIYPEDLDAWEKKAGLKIESGDVVLIRTGRWKRREEKGPWDIAKTAAGLHASCGRWLKERDIAMLGSDASSDVKPSGVPGVTHPVHRLVLIAMGAPIFDNLDLEVVADQAARQQRWEFLLTAAPIPVEGATGSPLNPIATF